MSRSSDLPNRATKMKQINKFSENEKRVLVQEVMAHADELFTKDAVKLLGKHISVKRHNIWSLIAKEVRKVNHTRRTVEDCQSAWNNYKRQITRTIDEIKKNFFITGNVEPLENILNGTQMLVVSYFRMDSDLEMKIQQLSGHSSMQEDSIQNRPVANQLSLSPAAGPTEVAPTLQQMTVVAASSSSPMTVASSVRMPQCSPMTSASHAGSLGRSENQTTQLAQWTGDNLPLPPEPSPSVQMPPPVAASPTPSPLQPVSVTATPQLPATAVFSVRAIRPSITSQSCSPSTTPLIQKKILNPSSSMISSCNISPKSLDEKVEELQSDVHDIQKQLKTVNSKCDNIKNMLQKIIKIP